MSIVELAPAGQGARSLRIQFLPSCSQLPSFYKSAFLPQPALAAWPWGMGIQLILGKVLLRTYRDGPRWILPVFPKGQEKEEKEGLGREGEHEGIWGFCLGFSLLWSRETSRKFGESMNTCFQPRWT